MVRVGRSDETLDELSRPSSTHDNRFVAHCFHQSAIDVPLIDGRFRVVSMRLEFFAPGTLLARQPLRPVGASSYLPFF